MNTSKKNLLFLLSFLTFSNIFCLQAQRLKWQRLAPVSLMEIGISGNSYKGDLNTSYDKWSAGVKLGILFNRKEKLNGGVQFSYQSVTGQVLSLEPPAENEDGIYPNTFFKSSVISGQYALRYNFIKKEFLHVYLSQGIGISYYNPQDEEGEDLVNQSTTRNYTEDYRSTAFYLPTEIGAIYLFRNGYGVGIQGKFFNILTDYLDNISELGEVDGRDNILSIQLSFYAPLSYYEKRRQRRR